MQLARLPYLIQKAWRAPSPGFLIDFTDEGAGEVNIVPTPAGGVASVSPTFTRATIATTVGADGLVKQVASGVPRSYYDPATGAYLGYLAEGARTNLLLRSEEFDNASWVKTDTTVTANSTISPDGTQNADLLTEGSTGGALITQQVSITANADVVCSVFLKRGNIDWVRLAVLDSTGTDGADFWFNLATGEAGSTSVRGTGTALSSKATLFPNGWVRCEVVTNIGNSRTSALFFNISAAGNGNTSRVNGATRYAWGAQLEAAAFASSYIPTTTAAVTRNADVLTYPTTGWLNASAGTIYVEYAPGVLDTTGRGAISLNGGTGDEEMYLGNVLTSRFIVADNASMVVNISGSTLAVGTQTKLAAAYAVNDFAISKGGGTVTVDTSGSLPTVNTASIGLRASGTDHVFGPIRRVAYWGARLSNVQLQTLSKQGF